MRKISILVGLAVAIVLAAAGGVAAQGLPGGASTLTETHGDWTVNCASPENVPRCSLSHIQLSNNVQRTRILAVELAQADDTGVVRGALILPFGLKLDDGASIAIDEYAPHDARFSTCLPLGCLVPLTLNSALIATMRQGTSLSVTVSINEDGQQAIFVIPLTGLASALDRLQKIAQT